MSNKKQTFSWLKALDQTGYPVTLNWKKENVYKTHLGGICSILQVLLIGLFTAGLITQWAHFDTYHQDTLEQETMSYFDCGTEGVTCTTMENNQWVPFVSIYNFDSEVDYTPYVTPQFWTYQQKANGDPDYQFYNAIPCD